MVGYISRILERDKHDSALCNGSNLCVYLDRYLWPRRVRGTESISQMLASAQMARTCFCLADEMYLREESITFKELLPIVLACAV